MFCGSWSAMPSRDSVGPILAAKISPLKIAWIFGRALVRESQSVATGRSDHHHDFIGPFGTSKTMNMGAGFCSIPLLKA